MRFLERDKKILLTEENMLEESKQLITYEELRNYLKYDSETGEWIWLRSSYDGTEGMRAGCLYRGYTIIKFRQMFYRSSRLAYYYMTGEYPDLDLHMDHINRIKTDDRWINLRLVTPEENYRNQEHKLRKDADWSPWEGLVKDRKMISDNLS